jgi:hypothetical protein
METWHLSHSREQAARTWVTDQVRSHKPFVYVNWTFTKIGIETLSFSGREIFYRPRSSPKNGYRR